MAATPDSVDAYIAALSGEARAVAEAVRKTIRSAAPDATEAISYGMPTFRLGGTYLIYFAAWKKHIGVYPIPRDTAFEDEVAPYRAAKDAVHFPYAKPIPRELIAKIVRHMAARLKSKA
jgi:uncharacterized protein YdhG (YjbR/CyaY superfamily)